MAAPVGAVPGEAVGCGAEPKPLIWVIIRGIRDSSCFKDIGVLLEAFHKKL